MILMSLILLFMILSAAEIVMLQSSGSQLLSLDVAPLSSQKCAGLPCSGGATWRMFLRLFKDLGQAQVL